MAGKFRNPQLHANARGLRKNITWSESPLWILLRNRKLANWKFRSQYVIEPYIVDFCCIAKRLVIEVDGVTHEERMAEDQARDKYTLQCGYRVLRFWNEDVKYREDWVIEQIIAACLADVPDGNHDHRGA